MNRIPLATTVVVAARDAKTVAAAAAVATTATTTKTRSVARVYIYWSVAIIRCPVAKTYGSAKFNIDTRPEVFSCRTFAADQKVVVFF